MLDPIALDHVDYIQPFLRQVEKWELHFCFFPRKCDLTEKKYGLNSVIEENGISNI